MADNNARPSSEAITATLAQERLAAQESARAARGPGLGERVRGWFGGPDEPADAPADGPRPEEETVVDAGSRGDLLGRLPIRLKLLLIALAFALPIVFVTGPFVADQNREIATTTGQLRGVEYLVPLQTAFYNVQLHRGVAARELGGDASAREGRLELVAEIDRSLEQLGAIDARFDDALGTSALFAEARTNWLRIRDDFATLTPAESTRLHTEAVIGPLIELITLVGDSAGLVLDPSLDGHYLSDLIVNQTPEALNTVGLVRTLGVQGASRGTSTEAQKAEMALRLAQAEEDFAAVERNVAIAFEASPLARQLLEPQFELTRDSVRNIFDSFRTRVLDVDQATATGGEFFDLAFDSFQQQHDLFAASIGTLGSLLQARLQEQQRDQLVYLLILALALAGTFALVGAIAQRIVDPVTGLADASERLADGDLDVLVSVDSEDELGVLAESFNTAVFRLREADQLQRAEIERSKRLQTNISDFLDVAMDIADGDLTQRGTVSEDVLGNVVDAINLMVEEIAGLMRQARDATEAVNAEANSMLSTTGELLESSATQRETALQARGEVQQVTGSMREMAATASQSASAAERALGASQRGDRAVSDTLEGMQNIRREVQGISKRIKALGDRSLEISEIIETISGIASQTNLLALNAAIEAAGAGEAGRRFATVADEVRRLAEESAGATKRVSGLIRSVQSEVQEVVASVEDGTREVEDGYRVAQEAGAQLREIGEIARQSAQFATAISESAQLQVQNVERVGGRVERVAGVAEASDERVRDGAEAAQRLQALAQQLTESLTRFRLG